jgi:hypothetical protein
MKKIITLKPTRHNSEDKPIGAIFSIDDDLYSTWSALGLAKEYVEPEARNEIENTLKSEDSIKPTKKKGQVKKNAKNS